MGKKVFSVLGLILLLFSLFAQTSFAKVINPVSEPLGEGWVSRSDNGGWLYTYVKEDANGNLVYCLSPNYDTPRGENLKPIGPVSELEANVLRVGYPQNNLGLNNDKALYATQVALYIASGAFAWSDLKFHNASIEEAARNILNEAKQLNYSDKAVLKVSNEKVKATPADGKYVTPVIQVVGDQGTYSVSLQGAPKEAKVVNGNGVAKEKFNVGEGFRVIFNAAQSGNFSITIDGALEKTRTMAYEGTPHDVQDVVELIPITKNKSTEVAVSWEAAGDLVVKKVDKQGNPLQGVTFEVKNSQGEVIAEGTSNEEGLVVFENLKPGDFMVYETKVPEGYTLNETEYDVHVKNGKKTVLTVKNERIQGLLEIIKVDAETKKALQGAEFTIYNEADEEVSTIVTNEDGIASMKLPYGKYTFKEIKAPEGYSLNENEFQFEIKSDGQVIKKKVADQAIEKDVETPVENNDQNNDKGDKEQIGGKLPKTSSDSLTNAATGLTIALVGTILFFFRKKRFN
ncbi:SpaA isopeptide-forming pilin-related protein [Virgibacillus siamensis]|uniref:SpaA isopeptide-forming pilin-related protein n=1 Tax=Virgibacillus siamensis TaxID=480071 RepID=UPI00158CFF9C|nr:SpaA isopeptide-forming pilin-related protein [Virgibacillus siamensis]